MTEEPIGGSANSINVVHFCSNKEDFDSEVELAREPLPAFVVTWVQLLAGLLPPLQVIIYYYILLYIAI